METITNNAAAAAETVADTAVETVAKEAQKPNFWQSRLAFAGYGVAAGGLILAGIHYGQKVVEAVKEKLAQETAQPAA